MMNELIPRDAVKYICRKETVSTNPDDHKHSSQFMDFMDDDAIADFGRWQWKNGFNTALVAVEVELEKLSSAQERKAGRWIEASRDGCVSYSKAYAECSECGEKVHMGRKMKYCPNCGSFNGKEVEHEDN